MVPGNSPPDTGLLGPCCHTAWFSGAAKTKQVCPRLQGPPGLKGEQGDTVVIDYDGRILDALKVSWFLGVAGRG